MTQIICSWLNDEVHLSQFIDENNFASTFSNGYLIGEILKKYDLMDNFDKLSKRSTAEAKLSNFILLEPILKLLGINFNNSVAKDVMESKFSILINLMYQLFIALENKKRSNTTALSMQTIQAPATTQIQEIESVLYQQRLKKITPRQTDMELKDLIKKYQDHQQTMQMKAEKERILSAEGHREETEKHRQNRLNRSKFLRQEQREQMRKIEAAVVKIPKPPPSKTIQAIQKNKKLKIQKEGEDALKELDNFERKQRNVVGRDRIDDELSFSREESFSISENGITDDILPMIRKSISDTQDIIEYIKPKSNKQYIDRIKARLESDKDARIAREKRRRKVLVNCLKSHYEQEENERENMIAMRLMRQSQMERRIAVQLLHLRHEKNVIKSNRLERETQYQERREKEFINALEKERELIEQMKLVNLDNLRAEQDLYDMKKAQHKMMKYRKHYEMAEKMIYDIVDLSCKMSEFKVLTEGKIPKKIIKEWKLSFINGVPIYDETTETENMKKSQSGELTQVVIQDIILPIEREMSTINGMEKKRELLDEEDILEYKQLIGEWEIKDESLAGIDRKNNILDWIVDRLQILSHPVDENSKIPTLPPFPIKAAVVGKCFSGKSMLIRNLVKNNKCVSIVPQDVINEALEAFQSNEEIEVETILSINENSKIDEDKTENQVTYINLNASMEEGAVSFNKDENNFTPIVNEIPTIVKKTSQRALLGEKINAELMNGRSINDQLLVETIVEKIRRIPDGTGWIIDDFPSTYQQAKLFEKAATGYEEPNSRSSRRTNSKVSTSSKHSGLDTLILLNTSDRDCLARAMKISENQLNDKLDNTVVSKDVIANLQTSLTNFAENWPKLSKFYCRINENLVKVVDSNQEMDPTQVYLQVEIILDDLIKQKFIPEPLMDSLALPLVEIEVPVETVIPDDQKSEIDLNSVSKEVVSSKKSGRKSKSSSRGSSAGSKSSGKKVSARKSRSKSKSESVNSKLDQKSVKKETLKKKEKDIEKRKGSKGSKGSRSSSKGSKGSKGNRTGSGKRKKSKVSQPSEIEKAEVVSVPEVTEPQPGDIDWVYAEKPLNPELSSVFYQFWESLNDVYVNNCKHVFREMRQDREEIIRYIHTIKKAFRMFLDRPDAKQEYLDQFQKDFNEIDDEWREDEEVQQELHQRISELKDQLLEISQENHADADKELDTLKNNRWLEDRVGLISNQYLNLMASEFDRFQDVVRFLKDYYKSMVNPTLEDFRPEFLRLPLIEIPSIQEANNDQQELNIESNKNSVINNATSPTTKKAAPKPAGKAQPGENQATEENKELTDEEIEAMFKTKIPLIEYRTPGPQIISSALTSIAVSGKPIKGDKAGSSGGIAKLLGASKPDKKSEKPSELSVPPNDLDEKLLYDTLLSCFTLAGAIIEMEISQSGQKDENSKAPANTGPEKGKSDKKGKGGKKSRTPTPKKGSKDKTATNTSAKSRSRSGSAKKKGKGKGKATPSKEVNLNLPQEAEETEEDKQNRLFLEKSKLEYVAALQKELSILRINTKVIMLKGTEDIKNIKNIYDSVFQLFSTWIADKLLSEDISIKEIEKVFRYHIEIKKPLKEKIELINNKFYLNPEEDSDKKQRVEVRPESIDVVGDRYFTIFQLKAFYKLFQSITTFDSASISVIDFVRLINDSLIASDPKTLPTFINLNSHTESIITNIAEAFSCDKEYVNWRLFLLACSEPWPWPTQSELMVMLAAFKNLDQQNTGFVTREQYDFIDLWFPIPSTPTTPTDMSIPKTINRQNEIKNLFFDIFKQGDDPNELSEVDVQHRIEYMNYEEMLMHFAIFCTNNFYSGIIRALSVASGQSLPHIPVMFKDLELLPDDDLDTIQEDSSETNIRIQDLYKVLSFGRRKFSSFDDNLEDIDLEDSESERDAALIKSLKSIYDILIESDELIAPFSSLLKHEALMEWFMSCQWFGHVEFQSFFPDDSFRLSADS